MKLLCQACDGEGVFYIDELCPTCHGINSDECDMCYGEGFVTRVEYCLECEGWGEYDFPRDITVGD